MVIATTDWATIATFATAIGTLVLAVATFAAVRSANLSARVAEEAFQVNLRPVLVPSRIDDLVQKIRWQDDHWAAWRGTRPSSNSSTGASTSPSPVRNVGAGLAVTFGWTVMTELASGDTPHADPAQFRLQTRDLYTPAGDIGFWQGAIRDASDPDYAALSKDIGEARPFTIDVLYGDHEGGQHTITRFGIFPRRDGDVTKWFPSVSRHWNLDRPDPR